MEFYYRNDEQRDACEKFALWAKQRGLQLYHQNAEKAPWHLYARVGSQQLYPQRIDFYPHKETAVWEGRTFKGIAAFDDMMMQVLLACDGEG